MTDEPITVERLKAAKFRVTMFGDGAKGMAFQAYRCIDFPRLDYTWKREAGADIGKRTLLVDGVEVKDLEEAAVKLNLPPAEAST